MSIKYRGCDYQCDNDSCPYPDCLRPSQTVKLLPVTREILVHLGKEPDAEEIAERMERKKQYDREYIKRKWAKQKTAAL